MGVAEHDDFERAEFFVLLQLGDLIDAALAPRVDHQEGLSSFETRT